MIIATWCGVGMILPRIEVRARIALAVGLLVCAFTLMITVTAINPTLTCRPGARVPPVLAERVAQGPLGRCREVVKYRLESVAAQRKIPKFYRDMVRTPLAKIAVVAIQGFGRFGPFGPSESDSVVRYQLTQDWGLVVWWPIVLVGILRTCRLGGQQLREGTTPTALALLIWALVSTTVVTWYLPLAWDRYLLPIQAPIALLAAIGLSAIWDRYRGKVVPA
jgi:hypothetical protein